MPGLSDSQERAVGVSLCYVEEKLLALDRLLAHPAAGRLHGMLTDLDATQRERLRVDIAALQREIAALADDYELQRRQVSLRRMVAGDLTMLGIALAEIQPARLRGCGEISPTIAATLAPALRGLEDQIRALRRMVENSEPRSVDFDSTSRAGRPL
jgi:hypothetical protein